MQRGWLGSTYPGRAGRSWLTKLLPPQALGKVSTNSHGTSTLALSANTSEEEALGGQKHVQWERQGSVRIREHVETQTRGWTHRHDADHKTKQKPAELVFWLGSAFYHV